MPIFREDLNKFVCHTPGCECDGNEVLLVGNCHKDAALVAVYDIRERVLNLTCQECGKEIANVSVSDKESWESTR